MLSVKEDMIDLIAFPTVQPDFPITSLNYTKRFPSFFPFNKIDSVPLPWSTETAPHLLSSSWELKPEAFIFPGPAVCRMAGGT